MKHSKTTKVIALLMSMTMITSVFVGNTLSRYVTSVSSTDSARVAVWGINAGEDTVMNLFDTKYIVDGKEIAKANDNGDGTFDKIMAPGAKGEAPFSIINFEQNVAPEVAYEVKISLDDSTIADEIKNNPSVQWKLDNGAYGTWDQLKTDILSLSGNAAGRHVYGPGEFAAAFQGTQEHKIAWQWLMDNDETITVDGNDLSSNEYDTYMGNLALTNDLNAVIKVSITAQQVDDLITNEYILDGANQIVSLNDVKPITIRSSADFSTFENVEVNDIPLTRDVDYIAEEGSTVITLTEEYLSKLAVGTYTIDIISNDVTATTTFRIVEGFIPDVPENQGVANALLNFKQLEEFSFVPKATIPQISKDIKPNIVNTGMPYSSSRIEQGYSPNFVSFETFMSAIQNPNSYLYTVDLRDFGLTMGATYYGTVCTTAVLYSLGITPTYTTYQWKYIPGMEPLEEQSVSALKLGDTISNNQSGHVVMITGINRNSLGEIETITVTEAASPKVKSTTYTADEMAEKYYTSGGNNYYVYYRYNKINEVKHTPSKYATAGSEVSKELYNLDIIPRKGDKANWLVGQPVEIDLFNSHYSDVEIYKDGTLFDTISLNREQMEIDRNISHISWSKGAISISTGSTSGSTKRLRSDFIPSIDLKITKQDNKKVSLFFYDLNSEYISSSDFITDENIIFVNDRAPNNAVFVRIVIANKDDTEISDINSFSSNFKIEISDNTSLMPITLSGGTISSTTGQDGGNDYRARTDFISQQEYKISVDNSLEYILYYYDKDKNYICMSNGWISEDTSLLENSFPGNTEYFRILIKNKDNSIISSNSNGLNLYSPKINLSLLGGKVSADSTIRLENLEHGSYKARLSDGTNYSDWCYWIVVDATSSAVVTGDRQIKVTFSASNAEPVFVNWSAADDMGVRHVNPLTENEKASGTAICEYPLDFNDKSNGKYKIRVAFKTEYGIIHSELGPVIDVN